MVFALPYKLKLTLLLVLRYNSAPFRTEIGALSPPSTSRLITNLLCPIVIFLIAIDTLIPYLFLL